MNLLEPEVRAEMSILWGPTGPPKLYVSKIDATPAEIGTMVADVIGLAIQWGASLGVQVQGTIAAAEKGSP